MKDNTTKSMLYTSAIGALVVGLIVGGGLGYALGSNNQPTTNSKTTADMTSTPTIAMTTEAGVMVGGAEMVPSKDIVDNAVNANNVTTLVAAVKAAGLVDTLKGQGPFTVFAPTNDAFSKLPTGTVDNLLKPENKSQLTKILTYHVIAGKYKVSDLYDGQMLTTVEGDKLTVKKSGNQIMIIGKNSTATIQTPDVISSNGVTHVIDTVLLP